MIGKYKNYENHNTIGIISYIRKMQTEKVTQNEIYQATNENISAVEMH